MPLDHTRARHYLQRFDLPGLFTQVLGWEHLQLRPVPLQVDGTTYLLHPVAEKRGVQVFRSSADGGGAVPPYAVRRRIEQQLAKVAFEHLIIFVDPKETQQVWQWVKREPGRPIACREHTYFKGQRGDVLLQKLERVTFRVSEEELLTLPGVVERLGDALDKDHVTKQFYERFKKEHLDFIGFIDGIREQGDREWYASIMLNRLMFVYFIQQKGFLDGDLDYLRNRLKRLRAERGDGEFHTFYRYFLRRLFHEALGQPESLCDADLEQRLGRVPYLNGGLFDVHSLEVAHHIDVPDEAFDRLFAFFDAYTWHADERPLRNEGEINPDVLGYIFEKHINQKQMGAYYTKEDITGYIARSTIVPWILEAARRQCAVAFDPAQDGNVWRLLRAQPDRYIWPSVRHGVIGEDGRISHLPPEVEAGVNDVTKRRNWNRRADTPFALPTETWHEHVARRQRCLDLRRKLAAGEIHDPDDLVTHNLDVLQFAQDAIETCEGPETLRAFYTAVRDVTILDPTCGSGAFLFAALNVLDPLHDACLDRMRAFVSDLDREGRPHHPNKFGDFRAALEELDRHPSQPYFVLKQLVLNNLYGVDIMPEAIEICKLRLFLKLVAQLDRLEDIEPLPDIDFNIRAGNTLIGFTTSRSVETSLTRGTAGQQRMLSEEDKLRLRGIAGHAEGVDRTFRQFRDQQTRYRADGSSFQELKAELRTQLGDLSAELDELQASRYGVEATSWSARFRDWKEHHRPFHWFADFYGIMRDGGFHVIIGNPPYIPASKVRSQYNLFGYHTADATDVYANVLERCIHLLSEGGRSGIIVPLSLTFSGNFETLRRLLFAHYGANWFSSFARIPAALFAHDVRVRNTIHLGRKGMPKSRNQTTVVHRWFEDARSQLFETIAYAAFSPEPYGDLVPKVNTAALSSALERLFARSGKTLGAALSVCPTPYSLHFKQTAYNWLSFSREQPPSYDSEGRRVPQTTVGTIYFRANEDRDLAFLLLNGKIEFAFWCLIGDDFHVTRGMFTTFPIDFSTLPSYARANLLLLADPLEEMMEKNIAFKLNAGKRVGNYNLARCRAVTDKSDAIFAECLGLADVWEDIELLYAQVVKTDFDASDD